MNAIDRVKAGTRKATRQRDNWKRRYMALQREAGRELAECTGTCPTEVRDWPRPGGCGDVCEVGREKACWAEYLAERAEKAKGGGA